MSSSRKQKLKHWAKEAAVAVAVFALVYGVMHYIQLERQRGGGGVLPVGSDAYAFQLEPARGDAPAVALAALRGKPIILSFWATWCGTCRDELPDLQEVHRRADGRYHLLTISSEPRKDVVAFLDDRGLELPVLLDRGHEAHRRYQVDTLPTTVIVDAQGRVVHDFTGPCDPDILMDHMERLQAL